MEKTMAELVFIRPSTRFNTLLLVETNSLFMETTGKHGANMPRTRSLFVLSNPQDMDKEISFNRSSASAIVLHRQTGESSCPAASTNTTRKSWADIYVSIEIKSKPICGRITIFAGISSICLV
jgi:hypothetical protein